jgi:hypothetical protein
VELFQTRYRPAADSFGEAWLTVDGKRQISWGDATYLWAEGAAASASHYENMPTLEANEAVSADLEARGTTMRRTLNVTLVKVLSLPISSMLKHRSPIVRGLAVLDRRVGKRQLLTLDMETEHPFVRSMFEFRCVAEGLKGPTRS